jgi:hypothetical protein
MVSDSNDSRSRGCDPRLINSLAVFYGGYGVILCPSLGVLDSYGGPTPEYHNALGFYVLSKSLLMLLLIRQLISL